MTQEFGIHVDSLSAEKMKVLALLLDDPNPIHFDATATQRLGISDRPVNQGPSSMAIIVNMLQQAFPDAKLARLTTKLLANAFAGDAVDGGGRVLERRVDRAKETILCEVWLDVRDGPRLLSGDAEMIRSAQALSGTPSEG